MLVSKPLRNWADSTIFGDDFFLETLRNHPGGHVGIQIVDMRFYQNMCVRVDQLLILGMGDLTPLIGNP